MATWVKLTLAIKMGIPFLARLLRLDEKSLYAFFDEIVRKYFPHSVVNEFIIKDDELLTQRVERDVDKAIEDLQQAEASPTIEEPMFNEAQPDGSRAQSLLGGEVSLTGPWISNKPND